MHPTWERIVRNFYIAVVVTLQCVSAHQEDWNDSKKIPLNIDWVHIFGSLHRRITHIKFFIKNIFNILLGLSVCTHTLFWSFSDVNTSFLSLGFLSIYRISDWSPFVLGSSHCSKCLHFISIWRQPQRRSYFGTRYTKKRVACFFCFHTCRYLATKKNEALYTNKNLKLYSNNVVPHKFLHVLIDLEALFSLTPLNLLERLDLKWILRALLTNQRSRSIRWGRNLGSFWFDIENTNCDNNEIFYLLSEGLLLEASWFCHSSS